MKNMRLTRKMFAVLALAITVLLVTNAIGIFSLNNVADGLIRKLYSDTYRGAELMLNADRDMYQALVDERSILSAKSGEEGSQEDYKSYEENIQQVRDRVGEAQALYESKKADYEELRHEQSKRSFFEAFEAFNADFASWSASSKALIDGKMSQTASGVIAVTAEPDDAKFHSSRAALNELEEMVSANASSYIDNVISDNARTTWILITIVVVASVAVVSIGWLVLRFVVRGIKKVAAVTEQIVSGNLQVEPIEVVSKDEIGQLGSSVNAMVDSLRQMIRKITEASLSLAAASKQIMAGTQGISGSSASQADQSQTIAALFKELSDAINSVARSAEGAAELSEQTTVIAKEGADALRATMGGMNELNDRMSHLEKDSSRIGDIIEVIDEIAQQTNLLALNAAIEAARAGDQGRGFAVVADEVRKLAERSIDATKQIASIVQGMQKSAESSVVAVADSVRQTRETGQSFERIVQMVNQSSGKVVEIAAASEEQAAQTTEVMLSVESIAASSQEMAAASEETAATTQSLAKLAEELNRLVVVFRI
ncbi:methyl-accepting chemotaxis protein [Cohnella suwonensis]|uniref:Methyl-accepting chemotaxis protein n=1 Tax=Cohnella suwonensis TaxID=696072 RepID=A0ABW0LYI7_9BACL